MADKTISVLDPFTRKNLQAQADGTYAEVVADPLVSSRVDATSTPGYAYYGDAKPGSLVGDSVWRICRVSSSGEQLWANGSTEFNVAWVPATYTALSYS
ncbi:hypothetical protein PSQ39_06590 [Curvibacter sp. HBC28]|uniref:Head decoration protein n=1 Tax=Curvibacter microcysteis TaxID=3026419 RepID=A0ABT5ME78_9BURK|nr:hypothetical protein [Curvibacter sp. HBC28]MDD0814294.1 hypothetical protein [Curvibacter sp. HBC28]